MMRACEDFVAVSTASLKLPTAPTPTPEKPASGNFFCVVG